MKGDSLKFNPFVMLVPAAIVVLAIIGGNIFLWSLSLFSLLLVVSSYAWAKFSINSIDGEVQIASRHYCQIGNSLLEDAFVINSSSLPKLMLRVWENTDIPGHDNRIAINLQRRGRYGWKNTLHCSKRGLFHPGSLTVEASDPFGFFHVQRKLSEDQPLLVYPATLNLPFLPLLQNGESRSARAYWLASEPCGVVSRVREYTPGDSLNYVHWRSTAHTGELMVKIPDPDASREVWVIVDAASDSTHNADSVFEETVSIAASQ